MERNLYFAQVYQSTRALEAKVAHSMLRILSFPRTLLEVFIRKNFGVRYFGYGQVILLILGLGYLGNVVARMLYYKQINEAFQKRIEENGYMYNENMMNPMNDVNSFEYFLSAHFASWYLFLLVFGVAAYLRHIEIKTLPSVFNFGRSSVYSGDINPLFINFRWRNKSFNVREMETILEPLACLLVGLALIILQQYIGYIIVIASIGYWLNNRICYYQGDHYIMDWIDNYLFNQESKEAFVIDEVNNAHGVRYYGTRPNSIEHRELIAEGFVESEIAVVR